MSWLGLVVILLIITVITAIAGSRLARSSLKVVAGIAALLALAIWLFHSTT